MSVPSSGSIGSAAPISLVVRRTIRAAASVLFEAWTQPEQLTQWWGAAGAVCDEAQVDLRPGGRLRISNRFADGRVVWIVGEFERIDAPRLIAYTWRIEPGPPGIERVTVRFEPRGDETEVIIVHERIADLATRDQHDAGWSGCLDGLARHVARSSSASAS